MSPEHVLGVLIQDVVVQLHQSLISYLELEDAENNWDPMVLTEALIIFLFTLNQDVRLANTSLIVSDSRIFPVLLNVYLNTLLL